MAACSPDNFSIPPRGVRITAIRMPTSNITFRSPAFTSPSRRISRTSLNLDALLLILSSTLLRTPGKYAAVPIHHYPKHHGLSVMRRDSHLSRKQSQGDRVNDQNLSLVRSRFLLPFVDRRSGVPGRAWSILAPRSNRGTLAFATRPEAG